MSSLCRFSGGRRLAALAVVSAAVLGCGHRLADSGSKSRSDRAVTICAASSTNDAVEEIAARFELASGFEVRVNAGASSWLANQIISGAPADLFLSANARWAVAVKEHQLALETHRVLSNGLVIVVPKGNPANIHTAADLISPAVRKVALAGDHVPAGIYAEKALQFLNLHESVFEGNRVVRGQNVRTTLSYVERGEVEAGIVYRTDAMISDDVEIAFTFEPESYGEIIYPALLLRGSEENPAAREFFDYLRSPDALKVFAEYGFVTGGVRVAER